MQDGGLIACRSSQMLRPWLVAGRASAPRARGACPEGVGAARRLQEHTGRTTAIEKRGADGWLGTFNLSL
jgi:hypothetical protein